MIVAHWRFALVTVAAFIAFGLGRASLAVESERIAGLICELGADEFERREAAAQALEKAGEASLPQLRQAALASKDFEIRARAEQIIFAVLRAAGVSKSTGLKLVVVRSGEFLIGAPQTEHFVRTDQTQHRVKITRPILLGAHEVTQKQYKRVMKVNPSDFAKERAGNVQRPDPVADKVQGMDTGNFPVEQVSWFDAVEFCNRLSEEDGYLPFYRLENVQREGESITGAFVTPLDTNGYRLPTEAEWEYACRAGSDTPYNYGGPSNGTLANIKGQDTNIAFESTIKGPNLGRTSMVGSYPPNAWGLYDMHGNVWEWCWDWYGLYDAKSVDDPRGSDDGRLRLQRGGAWPVAEQSCRSASRLGVTPGERKNFTGFRVARSP